MDEEGLPARMAANPNRDATAEPPSVADDVKAMAAPPATARTATPIERARIAADARETARIMIAA